MPHIGLFKQQTQYKSVKSVSKMWRCFSVYILSLCSSRCCAELHWTLAQLHIHSLYSATTRAANELQKNTRCLKSWCFVYSQTISRVFTSILPPTTPPLESSLERPRPTDMLISRSRLLPTESRPWLFSPLVVQLQGQNTPVSAPETLLNNVQVLSMKHKWLIARVCPGINTGNLKRKTLVNLKHWMWLTRQHVIMYLSWCVIISVCQLKMSSLDHLRSSKYSFVVNLLCW